MFNFTSWATAFLFILRNSFLSSLNSILACLGTVSSFLAITSWCNVSIPSNVLVTSIIFFLWWLVDGLFVTKYLTYKVKVCSNSFDTKIVVKFGDIFNQDGWKTIPVNDFFDSKVDNHHISESSLHGNHLIRYWSSNIQDWDSQVSKQLCDTEAEYIPRKTGKTRRYEIGTTAAVQSGPHSFLCVALAHTDINNLEAKATIENLIRAVQRLMKKARSVCAGAPLNLPLFGAGLSRVGLPVPVLIELILTLIVEETKQNKVTNEIRIILPTEKASTISLSTIKQHWS